MTKIARRFVSAWYHFEEKENYGKYGYPLKTSVNLRTIDRLELHQKHIRFYLRNPTSNVFIYQPFATHEDAEATYTTLIKRVDELR